MGVYRTHARILQREFARHGLAGGRDFTLTFEVWRAEDERATDAHVRRLVAMRPDVIVTGGGVQLWLLKRLTREIPVVFHDLLGDPTKLGLVESLRHPGGNFTGTSHAQHWESRMVGLLREFDRSLSVVGRLDTESALASLPEIEQWGRKERSEEVARRGIDVRDIIVAADASASQIAAAVRSSGVRALIIEAPMTPEVVKFVESWPLPAVGMFFWRARMGVLVAISYESEEGLQQSAAMVVRILHGETPANIPIYQHTRYALAVNLRTAAKAGIRVPDSILIQAVEVIR